MRGVFLAEYKTGEKSTRYESARWVLGVDAKGGTHLEAKTSCVPVSKNQKTQKNAAMSGPRARGVDFDEIAFARFSNSRPNRSSLRGGRPISFTRR